MTSMMICAKIGILVRKNPSIMKIALKEHNMDNVRKSLIMYKTPSIYHNRHNL